MWPQRCSSHQLESSLSGIPVFAFPPEDLLRISSWATLTAGTQSFLSEWSPEPYTEARRPREISVCLIAYV